MAGMRPVLIYDGDCGVCTRLSRLVTTRLRRRPEDFAVAAYQLLDLSEYPLTPEECDAALQWVAADGTVSRAQDAVARTLLACRPPLRPLGAVVLLPGVNALAGLVYRWVAANRHRLPGGTPACSLPASQRPA
jgi:predicted DCC family thiol-disulfide oxidoreductase YuxK